MFGAMHAEGNATAILRLFSSEQGTISLRNIVILLLNVIFLIAGPFYIVIANIMLIIHFHSTNPFLLCFLNP